MADRALTARFEGLHVPSGHGSEGIGGQRRFDALISQQMAPIESGQTDEFAAGIKAAVRGQSEEGAAGAAGRDVTSTAVPSAPRWR